MSWLELYTVTIVHLGLIPALLYPAFYLRSPWRSTAAGRALMTKGIAIAALFLVSVVGFWWTLPGYSVIYAATVTGVVAATAYQFVTLRRLQRQGRTTTRRVDF